MLTIFIVQYCLLTVVGQRFKRVIAYRPVQKSAKKLIVKIEQIILCVFENRFLYVECVAGKLVLLVTR